MHAVQAVDDVQSLLKWLKCLDGLGKVGFRSEPLLLIPSGMQVAGSKPWLCMKNMTRLRVPCRAAAAWRNWEQTRHLTQRRHQFLFP